MPKRGSADSPPPPLPWLTADGDDTIVAVFVVPRASRTGIDGTHEGRLRVRVAAPPIEGAANDALGACLSELFGVGRRAVSVITGHTGRRKRVRLKHLALADALTRLRPAP